jgi:hypothetical protein
MAIVLYGVSIQDAGESNDIAKMRELRAAAGRQLAELRGHIAHLDELIQQATSHATAVPPYGTPPRDKTVAVERKGAGDKGVVHPLYGVVDQLGSAVPLYGTAPNPVPLYGVVVQDALVSGDLGRMKAVASTVRSVLAELEGAKSLLGE